MLSVYCRTSYQLENWICELLRLMPTAHYSFLQKMSMNVDATVADESQECPV